MWFDLHLVIELQRFALFPHYSQQNTLREMLFKHPGEPIKQKQT